MNQPSILYNLLRTAADKELPLKIQHIKDGKYTVTAGAVVYMFDVKALTEQESCSRIISALAYGLEVK